MLAPRFVLGLALVSILGFINVAQATDTPADTTVTVVVPIQPTQPEQHDETLKALQAVRAVVAKQDGIVDETLLENKNPKGQYSYVHVMRWKSEAQWQAMLSNAAFLEAVKNNRTFFTIDEAMTYQPVKAAP